jgi:hypothetical protein
MILMVMSKKSPKNIVKLSKTKSVESSTRRSTTKSVRSDSRRDTSKTRMALGDKAYDLQEEFFMIAGEKEQIIQSEFDKGNITRSSALAIMAAIDKLKAEINVEETKIENLHQTAVDKLMADYRLKMDTILVTRFKTAKERVAKQLKLEDRYENALNELNLKSNEKKVRFLKIKLSALKNI